MPALPTFQRWRSLPTFHAPLSWFGFFGPPAHGAADT